MDKVTITTSRTGAEAIRLSLAHAAAGLRPWMALEPEHQGSAPGMLKVLDGAQKDVADGIRAANAGLEASRP